RARRVAADHGKRPEYRTPRSSGGGDARAISNGARLSAAAARVVHLGRRSSQARRHVEILEFLFEASGRLRTIAETHAGGSHGTDKNPRTTANVGGPRIHHEFS